MTKMLKVIFLTLICVLLTGCASWQLNNNTLEIASTVEDLKVEQILHNISKSIDDPDTTPDQVDVGSGAVTTTNSIGATINDSGTRSVVSAVTRSVTRASTNGLTMPMTDQYSQSWSVAPVTDGEQLRRLRALYGYAAHRDLRMLAAYPRIKIPDPNSKTGGLMEDPFFTDPEHVVYEKGQPGKTLCSDWLYFSGPSALTGRERLPDDFDEPVLLGTYGRHTLYTTRKHKQNMCLSNFVLLVQDAAGATESPSGGGSARNSGRGGGGSGGGRRRSPIIIPPAAPGEPQIIPR